MVPKLVQRALVGAGLGALMGTGGRFVAPLVVDKFLRPLARHPQAALFVGREIYVQHFSSDEAGWRRLSSREREIWVRAGRAALEAVVTLASRLTARK